MSYAPQPPPSRNGHTPYPAQIGESVLGHGSTFHGSSVLGSAGGGGAGEGDRFLSQARGIELTQEDKQEGYDSSLFNLQPRTGEAVDRTPPSSSDLEKAPASTKKRVALPPASFQPYESRDANGSKEKGKGRGGRRKKRKLQWYQRPVCLFTLLGGIIVVGLGVGLGVGLRIKKGGRKSEETSQAPPVSQSGVAVQSSGAGVVAGTTAVRPIPTNDVVVTVAPSAAS